MGTLDLRMGYLSLKRPILAYTCVSQFHLCSNILKIPPTRPFIMDKRPVLKGIPEQMRQEDPIRLLEVSEVISLFTGKGLGKQRSKAPDEGDLLLYV